MKESHLAALDWLAKECAVEVDGGEVGSREVVFRPTRRCRGRAATLPKEESEPDIIALHNPGSVWLIWQAIFPYVVFSIPHHLPHSLPH